MLFWDTVVPLVLKELIYAVFFYNFGQYKKMSIKSAYTRIFCVPQFFQNSNRFTQGQIISFTATAFHLPYDFNRWCKTSFYFFWGGGGYIGVAQTAKPHPKWQIIEKLQTASSSQTAKPQNILLKTANRTKKTAQTANRKTYVPPPVMYVMKFICIFL